MARLFFALWPDGAASKALARLAAAVAPLAGGKPVPEGRMHLTLAFLGEVAPERVAVARQVGVAGVPVELALDRLGAFRGAKVAWAGPAQPAPALLELQARLASELRRRGFALESRPFHAHVTLVRGIERPVPVAPVAPIAWTAGAVALVQTQPGTGRYATLQEWELRD